MRNCNAFVILPTDFSITIAIRSFGFGVNCESNISMI